MKMRTFAAASAALGLMASASAANAVITVSTEDWNLDGALAMGQVYIQDFDNPLAANFAYVGDNAYGPGVDTYVRSGPSLLDGESAPPPILNPDLTIGRTDSEYQTVENGGYASIEALHNTYMKTFSLYMGSPDSFNNITFRVFSNNTLLETLSGEQIWFGNNPSEDNGDQDWGKRIYYDFGGAMVTKVEFTATGGNSFEFDGLAATVAVPEPGTWALMILGFGGAGAMLRRRKMALA
jgi:hypothetical protein